MKPASQIQFISWRQPGATLIVFSVALAPSQMAWM
jgi:hypothetical protein